MAQVTRQARLSEETYLKVARLAEESNTTQTEIIDRAVKLYEREQFFAEMNAGFELLSEADRAELQAEREEWDETLADASAE
jgi:hypothetical protein